MYFLCFETKKQLEFLTAGRFEANDRHIHPKRNLPSAVLLLGFEGECPISQDGREYNLKRGTFQILFPNVTHRGTGYTEKGQSHFWCHFNLPEGFYIAKAQSAQELRQKGICVIPEFSKISDCEKYFVLFSQLIDESEKLFDGGVDDSVICDSYLKILLCSLADNSAESSSSKRVVSTKIREWFYANPNEEPTVGKIAQSLNYNPHYLTKLVKDETGMTFVGYINFLKIKKAKDMLVNTDLKICEIAYLSGYADEKYFIKVFNKYEKLTPKQYRYAYFRKNINNK